jgi:ATP phosphoribosyltransferase
MSERQLRLGVPKGSLQESTLALFARAGFSFHGSERSLWLSSNDLEIKPVLLRPQEIPRYVADGTLDCGLSGWDWICETFDGEDSTDHIWMLADLCYSKRTYRSIRWVLAVKKDGPYRTVEDLQRVGDAEKKISTELVNITGRWLANKGIMAQVSFSWGATEAKVGEFADAIVEATETGSSLEANGLKIIDTVLSSTTRFFANKRAYKGTPWKKAKLDGMALLLTSCLQADTKESVRVVAAPSLIRTLTALIPSDASFTVANSQDGDGIIDIVAQKTIARELIPRLARNGATRITANPLGILYEVPSNVPG